MTSADRQRGGFLRADDCPNHAVDLVCPACNPNNSDCEVPDLTLTLTAEQTTQLEPGTYTWDELRERFRDDAG